MAIAIDQIALICNCDLSVCAVALKGQLASLPQICALLLDKMPSAMHSHESFGSGGEGAILCSRVSRESVEEQSVEREGSITLQQNIEAQSDKREVNTLKPRSNALRNSTRGTFKADLIKQDK